MSPELLRGDPVATPILERAGERVERLRDEGTVPTLGTVLMSDDPADERFVELKHETCAEVGIATRDVRLDPDAPAKRLYREIERLSGDPGIDAVFVQVPLPDHVPLSAARRRLDPAADVDCLHPTNLGRLVAGEPRFVPATTAAVDRLLSASGISVAGADVVVVGRSSAIGRPLANRLLRDRSGGNATVTVCHSKTADLGAHTRRADVVVTAAGVPELVDGSMLAPEAVVVDVSANRRPDGTVVGDVDFESASERVRAITPVPGGVGPVTLAALVENVVRAADRSESD
ncbi:bifunctional 5,10-methylenetetrahydrofolate dehydrogenase/5,10-methenyltetrahydrofolate cyclohydrolase [Natronococcus jeotgali]|uniref:Bifunctional protein FolD n=1 Tax=Natronococcus jeotgali DSM 18795 TaxID=1227498 RepID=L9WUD4_9EURY|nr:bifunctional 5,10-methylene-tetrahydrofolate dehydrogenase/5,10-methylene-tetrahydrofolate cyclohydrolase [Natronococcus jeotgali]ELY53012.1 bifunctional 5,10-methylene-tetrahydrofolate dehydrogenase/ 5,10-methylene-tetrahydrofolate cyclohydrolase [Natronococcus jeotgali DSM 18795]